MPNPEETSKSKAHSQDVPLESAAPFGHDEIESQIAKEALGDGAATEPVRTTPNKKPAPAENPKRLSPKAK